MALLVLCDPKYRNTVWCDNKIRGIQDEVSRRREKLRIFTDINTFEAAAAKLGEESSVIILFDAISYIQQVAPVLARLKIHPMFSGLISDIKLPFQFSSVALDLDHSSRVIVDYLRACGKTRIAEVGVNPNSWSDVCRSEILGRYVKGENHRVFYAKKKLTDSYREFLAERENFDAVICTTDLIGIALIEFLKQHGAYDPSLFFISHGDTVMARLYDKGITSVTTNYYACGKAAAETHFNRLKYGWSSATILLKNSLNIRGSTGNLPYTRSEIPPQAIDIHPVIPPFEFSAAPTIPLGKLERMLANSDVADLRLLYCLLTGYSYEKTAEFCFLSVGAVKYRLCSVRDALKCESSAEAAAYISTYVSKERLLEVIEELEGRTDRLFTE